jgi:hypothetical protein
MHLNVANLSHFLICGGILDAEAVVFDDLRIVDSSSRNSNFKIMRATGPGLFVKQMRDTQSDAMLTLKREAACYELAREHPALSRLMPRLVKYDAARHVLVVELLPEAESLGDYHVRQNAFPVDIGGMLGHALGTCHAQSSTFPENKALEGLIARHVPAILRLGRGGHAMLGKFGRIGPSASAVLQQHEDLQALLDALGAEWRFDSLIHGDMRWDNVLMFPAPAGLDFRIVDWEMADFGDAAWDVGTVLQGFLSAWILSMPVASHLPPEAYVGVATQPLESMQPELRAFWNAYASIRGIPTDKRAAELQRCMRFGAARLALSAIERCMSVPQLDAFATAYLQVSLNILQDPARAVRDLLDA